MHLHVASLIGHIVSEHDTHCGYIGSHGKTRLCHFCPQGYANSLDGARRSHGWSRLLRPHHPIYGRPSIPKRLRLLRGLHRPLPNLGSADLSCSRTLHHTRTAPTHVTFRSRPSWPRRPSIAQVVEPCGQRRATLLYLGEKIPAVQGLRRELGPFSPQALLIFRGRAPLTSVANLR